MNGLECRLESGCLTQPLSLAYDKVQMKIKHLGCTAVSIVTVFVILSLSCTRSPRLSSETAAETPSDQPSFPGEDSPDAADAAPESFEPEVSAVQEPTEQPASRPVENVAAAGAAEDIEPPIEQPGIELPENLVIDEVTPYLDFFFERDIFGLESETLFGKRDYKAARENFSFLIGRSVDIRYFPVIARFQIGLEPDIYIPEKAGFKGNAVYLDAAPEKDLIVRTRNTIDDTVYSHVLKAENFYNLREYYLYDFHGSSDKSVKAVEWWIASIPFLPTYFLSEQRFNLELIGSDGSVIAAGEFMADLSGSFAPGVSPFGVKNEPIGTPRVNPFQNEVGIRRDQTMYLQYLPEKADYVVFYKNISDLMIPVAATFLESEPTPETPVKFHFGPQFPSGEYSFEVIDNERTIIAQFWEPEEGSFRSSGALTKILSTAEFTAP